MRSFFDPALIEEAGTAFIREDKVDDALRTLIPNAHITKGSYTTPGYSNVLDLAWNHMDQNHRPYVHNTYGAAMRVAISDRTAFSITRFGNWPAIIPVFDGRHRENGFYQILCLFGLFVIVNVIECNTGERGTRMNISWAIASHRWLRWLHPYLDRRLQKLNVVQNDEDAEIRHRRVELRRLGYRFETDSPDFLNSNALANNVVFPPLTQDHTIKLSELDEGRAVRVDVGDRAYIFSRQGENIEVWPGVCPHEGAELSPKDLQGSQVKCRWHGLGFGSRKLGKANPLLSLCGARLQLEADRITITALQQAGQ